MVLTSSLLNPLLLASAAGAGREGGDTGGGGGVNSLTVGGGTIAMGVGFWNLSSSCMKAISTLFLVTGHFRSFRKESISAMFAREGMKSCWCSARKSEVTSAA